MASEYLVKSVNGAAADSTGNAVVFTYDLLYSVEVSSPQAALYFPIDFNDGYRKIEIEISNMLTDTSNYEVWLRTGVGDPVSYFSGASDYTSVLVGSVGSGFNLGAAQIKLAQNGSSTYPFFAKIELFDPFNSGIRKKIFFHAGNHDSGTPTYNYDFHGNGVCNTNTDAVSGIMIRTNSGNIIDGLFQVKGYL